MASMVRAALSYLIPSASFATFGGALSRGGLEAPEIAVGARNAVWLESQAESRFRRSLTPPNAIAGWSGGRNRFGLAYSVLSWLSAPRRSAARRSWKVIADLTDES